MGKMDLKLKKCETPKFRVSYPQVHEAKSFEGQPPKFGIVMLYDKSTRLDIPVNPSKSKISMKQAAENAAIEKWGPDKKKWPKNLRMPFRDGDEEKEGVPGYENVVFVSARSKERPGLVDQKRIPITESDGTFYAGCYARASLIAFAYDTAGNRGVSFALRNIQKLGDGKRFGGGVSAEEEFDEVEDQSDSPDSYESHDDDSESESMYD